MLLSFSSHHFKFTHHGFIAALLFVLRAVFLCLALFIFLVSAVSIYAQTTADATLYFMDPPTTVVSGEYVIKVRATDRIDRVALQFNELPNEDVEMKAMGDSTFAYTWDTRQFVDGSYHLRAYAFTSTGQTIFAEPILINIRNIKSFDFQITEPRINSSSNGSVRCRAYLNPVPDYFKVSFLQNNQQINEIDLIPTIGIDYYYTASWEAPASLEGQIEIKFMAGKTGYESVAESRLFNIVRETVTSTVAATTTQNNLDIYFIKPTPRAVLGTNTSISLSANYVLDALTVNIDGPLRDKIVFDTTTADYSKIWDISNFPDGKYTLKAEAKALGMSQLAEIEVEVLKPVVAPVSVATSTSSFNEDYYLEFLPSDSIVSGSKKFEAVSNLPETVIKAYISGPKNGEIELSHTPVENNYFFWWDLESYPKGLYRIELKAEHDNRIYSDFINVEYNEENFDVPESKTEADTYVLEIKDFPASPVSGQLTFNVVSNYRLDKVQMELGRKRFEANKLNDFNYNFKINTLEFANGNYSLMLGGILNGQVMSEVGKNIIIKNINNESEGVNTEAERVVESEIKEDIFPSESPETVGAIPIDPDCVSRGIRTEVACEQYLSLEPECKEAGKTSLLECRQFLSLDPNCRTLGLDSYQCRLFLELPGVCQAENVLTEVECRKFIYQQALPQECREANILNQKDCDAYFNQKNTTQTENRTETKETELNKECAEAGLETEACNLFLREKYLARECVELGIESLAKCDQTLLSKYSGQKCAEAGIDDTEECRSYLINKFSQAVQCEELGLAECRLLIKERYLGELIIRERQAEAIDKKVKTFKNSVSLFDLAESDNEVANILPLQLSQRKVRVLRAQSGTIIDKNLNLQQSSSLALGFDQDDDGLIDSVEERIGTNPNHKDSDRDGYGDGEEIRNGFNPLGSGRLPDNFLSPIDEALLYELDLGQPKTSGKLSSEIKVDQIENNVDDGHNNSGYVISGQAEANSVLTVYVYSDLPIVATVKSDEFGNWQYELGDLLSEGNHEIYVSVNDNTGKVLKKSSPINFFVKEARAVSIEDFVAGAAVAPQSETEIMISYYVVVALIIITVSLLLFFILFVILKNKQA